MAGKQRYRVHLPMSERYGKLRRALIEPMADVWLSAYIEALGQGLHDQPSGPVATDPVEQWTICGAAWIVSETGLHGGFPEVWGGRARPHESIVPRWSAPRRAALAVFHAAIAEGLTPVAAARAVSVARMRVRERLGVYQQHYLGVEGMSVEEALSSSPARLELVRKRRHLRAARNKLRIRQRHLAVSMADLRKDMSHLDDQQQRRWLGWMGRDIQDTRGKIDESIREIAQLELELGDGASTQLAA